MDKRKVTREETPAQVMNLDPPRGPITPSDPTRSSQDQYGNTALRPVQDLVPQTPGLGTADLAPDGKPWTDPTTGQPFVFPYAPPVAPAAPDAQAPTPAPDEGVWREGTTNEEGIPIPPPPPVRPALHQRTSNGQR